MAFKVNRVQRGLVSLSKYCQFLLRLAASASFSWQGGGVRALLCREVCLKKKRDIAMQSRLLCSQGYGGGLFCIINRS